MTTTGHTKSNIMNTDARGLRKHKMSTFTIVFMIFSLVAAGCYGIEDMIPESGPGLTLILLIVLPFVWGLPFGLVASELGSVRPQEGGYYKWVQEALGEFWGFQAGWWRTISIYIDNTLYVVLAGGYLSGMFDMSPVGEFLFKAAMILLFMWINIRGVGDVGVVTNILSIFVIAAFAMVAIIGFANWGGNPFEPLTAYPIEAPTDWIFYIGAGLSIGMWMYSGYESMSTIAGEIEDPQVISKATLISVPLIMATYILPTMASISAFKTEGAAFDFSMWGSEGDGVIGYASLADHFMGPAFGIFFGVVAVVAQGSIFNTYIASGSRGFFSLADDHLAPKFLVKVDKKHGVPYVAVISVAVVNLALCMVDFSTLVVVDVFLLVSSYILVYISALILRKRIPKHEYKFRIPGGYGFLCVLCIVPICIAFFSFLINGSDYFIGGMVGILSGPIIYYIWKRMYGGLAKVNPAHNPVNPKTHLASRDLTRMAVLFGILTLVGIAGSFFLPWYEAEWAFPDDYDMTLFAGQTAMWHAIRIATIVSGGLTIVLVVFGKLFDSEKPVDSGELTG
ncbi:MAG: APC family permease [Clostridiales Family XIII bacterium]|jgi:amino acid transporter|nr:APC family permease [Clostridiales Family XIII bacterium]